MQKSASLAFGFPISKTGEMDKPAFEYLQYTFQQAWSSFLSSPCVAEKSKTRKHHFQVAQHGSSVRLQKFFSA